MTTPTDPGAIDLDNCKLFREHTSPERADALIAAIEALRERVAVEQELKQGYHDSAAKGWQWARAAEARVAEIELAASVRNVKIGKALGDRALAAEAAQKTAEERVVELEKEVERGIKWQQFYMGKLDRLGKEE